MPEPGKGKENWEESWANAFEEGFYDNLDGAEDEKKALIVETDAQGRQRVVGVATGAEAEKMIAEAQASGVEVHQNATQVEQLLEEQSGATDVPPEVYELLSTLIEFAHDLGQEWESRGNEMLPRAASVRTEVEYGHDDVEAR